MPENINPIPIPTPGLTALLGPNAPKNLFLGGIPREPVVVHGLGETIAELKKIPALGSLGAMLNSWNRPVQAHLPDEADESSAIDASPADARKLFANGMALLFNEAEKNLPVLKTWLEAIHRDLGLPTSTHGRCMVYATPDGKGTAPHFDQNINFVLQLHGTKKWSVAPNLSVENPTQRFTQGQVLDPELAGYHEPSFPMEMPDEREEIILTPGSMLFVPRGYWHTTEASGEALALNFTFSQPTWADLLILALRSRLLLSAEWRELASGVTSRNDEIRLDAEAIFDGLLAELITDLPHWRAEDILAATEDLSRNRHP